MNDSKFQKNRSGNKTKDVIINQGRKTEIAENFTIRGMNSADSANTKLTENF